MNRILKNIVYHFPQLLSDRKYIELRYLLATGVALDLDNPKTFNEKLNWLKLNDRNPIYTRLVDKAEVKEYVSSLLGEEYVIPSLGVWESFDEIVFDSLPDDFVLKCTHDSGSVVIVRDKSAGALRDAGNRLRKAMRHNFYWKGREWPYRNVSPRILAEPYLSGLDGSLNDYKFFCFNGKMKCFKVDFDRFADHRANYYDENCNLMTIGEVVCPPDFRDFTMPSNLDQMIAFAEKLSAGFPFVRVDFYNVSGKIFFGEFTLYPDAGYGKFTSPEADLLLGSWLQLT